MNFSAKALLLNKRPFVSNLTLILPLSDDKKIGKSCFLSSDENEIQGLIDYDNKRIVLNASDGATRKRFTIAHEIGHITLHRAELESDPDLGVMRRQALGEANADPREREANYFAACLLMPANLVRRYYNKLSQADLATLFLVSEEAMSHRLDSLCKDGVL